MAERCLAPAAALVAALLAGCQLRADPPTLVVSSPAAAPLGAAALPALPDRAPARLPDGPPRATDCRSQPAGAAAGALAGRVLPVRRPTDLALRPGEVVLTFDDGPAPGRTPAILDTLERYGVHATFMMVGAMAQRSPALVREVARRGHTIGSHTEDHGDLAQMDHASALASIAEGERHIAAALSGSGKRMAPFFRFPYLADTPALRRTLAERGTVVLRVDIDSRDYAAASPQEVVERTLAALAERGEGVLLFHDIHQRTVAALPSLLEALRDGGYRVVRLVPQEDDACSAPRVATHDATERPKGAEQDALTSPALPASAPTDTPAAAPPPLTWRT